MGNPKEIIRCEMNSKHIKTDTPEQIEWTRRHIKEEKEKNKVIREENRKEV